MKELVAYQLKSGKTVWTNSLEAFKGTIFEGKIILPKTK